MRRKTQLNPLLRQPTCDANEPVRTNSDRYAELRALVEELQREAMDPASPLVVFTNGLNRLLEWSHR